LEWAWYSGHRHFHLLVFDGPHWLSSSGCEGRKGMSKNLELMQETLREMQPEHAENSDDILFPTLQVERNPQAESLEFEPVAPEECLRLVQRVFLGQPTNSKRAIVFAGIDPRTGCTRICVDAARTLAANTSGSVCLVEANFRAPALPNFFGVPNHRGLADSLTKEGNIRTYANQLQPPNLWLLSAGAVTPASAALLNSDGLRLRLHELREDFNYILVDAPALNLYPDAVAMGRVADGMVVVLQADSTRRESALKALESLRAANVEVLGAVLNRRTFPIPNFLYHRL
jgi:Mrp family chromosome partitioning ATPase